MQSTTHSTVNVEVNNRVALLTMNRPQVMNACNRQMREELTTAFAAASADDDVRVVVLTGEGRGFGVGQDLAEGIPPGEATRVLLEQQYKPMMLAIDQSDKLFIAAVNGAAAGVSGALALNCDLVLMADNAYFYQAFINVGLIPDGGACWQLTRQLGYRRALEMVIAGEKLAAQRCLQLGLANRVVPADSLLPEAQAWAEQIAAKAPLAVAASKRALKQSQQLDLAATLSLEAGIQAQMTETEDAQEAVRAFLEKRVAVFNGR